MAEVAEVIDVPVQTAAPAVYERSGPAAIQQQVYTQEQIELVKRSIMPGASNDELSLFIAHCKRTGLDPFSKQIYAIKRWDGSQGREVFQPQASIDGYRLTAQRTGEYAGQVGPFWCGKDGVWRDVWLEEGPPAAAKVGVIRHGHEQPIYSVALYKEYVQRKQNGDIVKMWKNMPANQLAKCAESLAIRRAFPAELAGIYTEEEMGQADNDRSDPINAPAQVGRGSQDDSGASQPATAAAGDRICPACGSDNVYDNRPKIAAGEFSDKSPKFKCGNKECTGANADGEVVTEGDAGKPWVTWHEHFFDPKPEPAGSDSSLWREISGHVDTGTISKNKVIPMARRAAKAHDEDPPTSFESVATLSEAALTMLAEEVAQAIAEAD